MKLERKKKLLQKRRWRIRKRVKGTIESPRLSLKLSNNHIYAQCIDDLQGKTICGLTSYSKDIKAENYRPNIAGAKELGLKFGEKAKSAGIQKVVFDRNGKKFHGAVKAFVDGVKKYLTV